MAERKGQVEARMDVVQQQQRESLERREELLKDMERANSLAKQEAEQLQKEKVQTKIEIDAQVSNFIANGWSNCVLFFLKKY